MRRLALVVLGAAGLWLALGWGGPRLLRRMALFRVRRVELLGTRFLAPDDVVRRLGLSPRQNLFDDLGELTRRARQLDGVLEARVERRWPSTLRIVLREAVPIALAPGPAGLVPLDAEGRALPYDPAATGLALPVVPRADARLLRALAAVRAADSSFFQDIQAAEWGPRGTVVVDLGSARVLLDPGVGRDQIEAVAAVRRHLAAGGPGYRELDGRFRGWVVARRASS